MPVWLQDHRSVTRKLLFEQTARSSASYCSAILQCSRAATLLPQYCWHPCKPTMTLGEAYLKDILRAPPTDFAPANTPHPFQKSLYTYVTKKFIPKHWFLVAGFSFTLFLYGNLDSLRDAGKKKAYDEAVLAGKQPYTAGGH